MIQFPKQPGRAPNKEWSHRDLVKALNAYAAGNQKLSSILQQQDLAAKWAVAEIAAHRDLLANATIVMPWHRPTIALMEKLLRILAGTEPMTTLTLPCHACGTQMTVPNLGPQPKDAVPLCMECAQLVNDASAALQRLPAPRQAEILAKYACTQLRELPSLQKPTLINIINKETKP